MPERAADLTRLDAELDRGFRLLRDEDRFDVAAEALASNAHHSTRLEGNLLGIDEVRRLTRATLRGARIEDLDEARQEVVDHVTARLHAERYALPWSERTLRDAHRALMSNVMTQSVPGEFRTGPSYVVQGKVAILEGAEPASIAREVDSLLDWLNSGPGATLPPTVAATVFLHEFESIHPFEDGNGRVGRVLFDIFLQGRGLPHSPLCKLDVQLVEDLGLYYGMLGWADHHAGYTEIIDFVTEAALEAYREAIETCHAKVALAA